MEKSNKESWKKIDNAIEALMGTTDELSDADLRLKSRRLAHLSAFTAKLAQRVNERLRQGVKQGDMGALFEQYHSDRSKIDRTETEKES